ncbi:MAG: transcription-repair coupling factor [Limnochordaceae bacterium]|nr:transcription-repair coupling factor [Limnochordaceae bacterium]
MPIGGLLQLISQSTDYRWLETNLRSGVPEQELTGLAGAMDAALIATAYQRLGSLGDPRRPGLVITPGQAEAERLSEDLVALLGERDVLQFPALEIYPYEETRAPAPLRESRRQVLLRLTLGDPVLVVAPIQAIVEPLLPPAAYRRYVYSLRRGQRIENLESFAARLVEMGYERVTQVEEPGQFGIRGDIVDIYPAGWPFACRVDLFDQEIDSLRRLDPATQRSSDDLDEVTIGPVRESPLPTEGWQEASARVQTDVARQAERLSSLGREGEAAALRSRIERQLELLSQGVSVPGEDQFRPYFYSQSAWLPDYLQRGSVVLLDSARLADLAQAAERERNEALAAALEHGLALPAALKGYAGWLEVLIRCKQHPVIYLSALARRAQGMQAVSSRMVTGRSPEAFYGQPEKIAVSVREWQKSKYRLVMTLASAVRVQKLAAALADENVVLPLVADVPPDLPPGQLVGVEAGLSAGFELSDVRLVVLTDRELLGQERRHHTRRPLYTGQGRITNPLDVHRGDYVVHVTYGIGQFLGVETKEIAGVHKDYIVLRYAGEDRLYVPVEQVELLQKYIGSGDRPPRLSRLGGGDWARLKKRVKESVREVAENLVKLYAERQVAPGHAFSPDTEWQREFEDAFAYEETPDQLRAMDEIKKDMESSRPMDRLLCGDVGYGKTEVAMRASFKAVADGKQVAVLVPTTILAQQHLRTFQERFEGYPVVIEAISRFQSPAEQENILTRLKQGAVDIIIGTHRLLSKDVVFKDLGLVIVDEEQRFGVLQKERLKELCKSVDILTMTATPIPRTLQMALSGVRDMSVIETPPEDRYPVRTYVTEYRPELVQDAIRRELARDGQVFVVINRIQGIDRVVAELRELVPEARIAVAHGQMDEARLERVMLDFLGREYDVLVCTTIIENGLDLSNVNTLIVLDADKMGLAQLYQLRGRVGRSNRVAYAYFTYRPERQMTEDAQKRLTAIREFTQLGSGFKIALRDLEIRGAGNILGAEQHGFIASVGFEMYNRLLEEAVQEQKGVVPRQLPEPVIDLAVDAYLSDDYIPDSRQKVEIYRRVVGITEENELDELAEELRDRFGPLPPAAGNLLRVARLKVLARQLGIHSILGEGELGQEEQDRPETAAPGSGRSYRITVRFLPGVLLEREAESRLLRRFRAITVRRGTQVQLQWWEMGIGDSELLDRLLVLVRLVAGEEPETTGRSGGLSGVGHGAVSTREHRDGRQLARTERAVEAAQRE